MGKGNENHTHDEEPAQSLIEPDLSDVPEDDSAEPLDADAGHTATEEEVGE